MREVAKRAGVGIGTVSRVLNGTGYVSDETRKKIVKAMKELDYEPPASLKSPAKKTRMIGIMVPDIEHPFFAKMMRCLDIELSRTGCRSVFCNTGSILNRQGDLVEMLDHKEIDGIIALGDPPVGFQGRKGRAIVCMDRVWPKDVPMIRSDHSMGGHLAAGLFLKKGCKKVVQFLGGDDFDISCNLQYKTMERVLTEHGCEVVSIFTIWNGLSYTYNKDVVYRYWDIIKDADGCITSDIGAVACLVAAKEMGMEIPEKFKLIAYDGTEITNIMSPEITEIQQDCAAIASHCVEKVLKMIDGEKVPALTEIPVSLYERGTT